MYGEPSETFKGFTFRPHADWLCFSVEAQGRTIDFAAQQDAEVCSWVVGLTALLREQTKRDASYATNQHGVQDVGISRGIFLWRMLEMRMKDEVESPATPLSLYTSSHTLPPPHTSIHPLRSPLTDSAGGSRSSRRPSFRQKWSKSNPWQPAT